MTVVDAILAAVQTALPGIQVYDAQVPETPAARYAVLYADNGLRESGTIDGRSDMASYNFQLTTVVAGSGLLRQECQFLSTKLKDALIDEVLVASEWHLGPVRHVLTNLPIRDESIEDRMTLYSVDQFQISAARLSA